MPPASRAAPYPSACQRLSMAAMKRRGRRPGREGGPSCDTSHGGGLGTWFALLYRIGEAKGRWQWFERGLCLPAVRQCSRSRVARSKVFCLLVEPFDVRRRGIERRRLIAGVSGTPIDEPLD